MALNVWDYVRVRWDLIVWDKYWLIICDEHDQFAGQIVKISEIIWEKPNLFYKLEGDNMYLFSKEMLEIPTMEEVEKLHEVVVVEVEAPKIKPMEVDDEAEVLDEKISSNFSPEYYVSTLKEFVDRYRDSFKDEEMFWDFFYDKATTQLYLCMKWIKINTPLDTNESKWQPKKQPVKKKK